MSVPVLRRSARCAAQYTTLSSHTARLTSGGGAIYNSQQYRSHSTDQPSPFTTPSSSSVSQNEVSHFTKLASSWWDPHGPSRLLHLMNPLRHDFIASCLETDPLLDQKKKYKYLDIGCGGGIFATSAARLPNTESVTAIDPTPSVIQVAKAKQRSDPALSSPKLTYLNCAIEDLSTHTPEPQSQSQSQSQSPPQKSTASSQFDIVTLFEVIEHISQPSSFLHTALAQLRPGGWLIGSTIARHPLSYITTKLIAEAPIIGIVPAGTHDWNQYINPSELRSWFEKEGSEKWGDFKVQGVIYVPFLGWKFVNGSEGYGNYFFGVQKKG